MELYHVVKSLLICHLLCCACIKGKGKGLDTCYGAAYMSQTQEQKRFIRSGSRLA